MLLISSPNGEFKSHMSRKHVKEDFKNWGFVVVVDASSVYEYE